MTQINLSILQHNVLNWKTHRIDLINVYNEINPEVILINSHGNKTGEKIKIFNYVTYQCNKLVEIMVVLCIGVRVGIKHMSSIPKRVTSTFFHIFHPYQYISQTVAANYTIVKRK